MPGDLRSPFGGPAQKKSGHTRIVVVLPAPFGPSRPTTSPGFAEKEMEFTAKFIAEPFGQSLHFNHRLDVPDPVVFSSQITMEGEDAWRQHATSSIYSMPKDASRVWGPGAATPISLLWFCVVCGERAPKYEVSAGLIGRLLTAGVALGIIVSIRMKQSKDQYLVYDFRLFSASS